MRRQIARVIARSARLSAAVVWLSSRAGGADLQDLMSIATIRHAAAGLAPATVDADIVVLHAGLQHTDNADETV